MKQVPWNGIRWKQPASDPLESRVPLPKASVKSCPLRRELEHESEVEWRSGWQHMACLNGIGEDGGESGRRQAHDRKRRGMRV